MQKSYRVKRIFAAFSAALMLLPLAACSKIPKSTKEEKETVLTIDEYEVPYEQLRYFVRNYMDSRSGGDADYWTEERVAAAQEEIFEKSIDALKDQYAILSLCKQYGIERDDGAITELAESTMDSYVAAYEDEAAYVADLEANHLTHAAYTFFTTVELCREELYYAMLEAGDLEQDTDMLHDLIYGDEFIRVKQILIQNDAGESAEENLARAEEARQRALDGEDFDDLVREYGEDLYMFMNTDGYYICRGVWYTEFEEAAFSLSVGEISPVIETSAGYSVLMRCEKETSFLDKNFDDLCADYRDAQFSLTIEERAAAMKATERDALAQYTLLTME